MRDLSGHSPSREGHSLWRQQVQLARGHWRREEAAGTVRSAGWWESVTVTWAPVPAPERPAAPRRALAAAADAIVPLLADAAVAAAVHLLERRHRAHPVASSLRRQVTSAAPTARAAVDSG